MGVLVRVHARSEGKDVFDLSTASFHFHGFRVYFVVKLMRSGIRKQLFVVVCLFVFFGLKHTEL